MTETPYTDPFWEGLADGRFLVHVCEDCTERFFPPSPICPACHSERVDWVESTGRGTIYSVTRQHATAEGFPDELVAGVVELDDGPRLLTPIDEAYDELAIGDPVVIEPCEYPHGYDRGRHSEYPFLVARTVDDGDD